VVVNRASGPCKERRRAGRPAVSLVGATFTRRGDPPSAVADEAAASIARRLATPDEAPQPHTRLFGKCGSPAAVATWIAAQSAAPGLAAPDAATVVAVDGDCVDDGDPADPDAGGAAVMATPAPQLAVPLALGEASPNSFVAKKRFAGEAPGWFFGKREAGLGYHALPQPLGPAARARSSGAEGRVESESEDEALVSASVQRRWALKAPKWLEEWRSRRRCAIAADTFAFVRRFADGSAR